MDLKICQQCGTILRGPGAVCKGCGALASPYSGTNVSELSGQMASALTVPSNSDPLMVERTINNLAYLDRNKTNSYGSMETGSDIQENYIPHLSGQSWSPSDSSGPRAAFFTGEPARESLRTDYQVSNREIEEAPDKVQAASSEDEPRTQEMEANPRNPVHEEEEPEKLEEKAELVEQKHAFDIGESIAQEDRSQDQEKESPGEKIAVGSEGAEPAPAQSKSESEIIESIAHKLMPAESPKDAAAPLVITRRSDESFNFFAATSNSTKNRTEFQNTGEETDRTTSDKQYASTTSIVEEAEKVEAEDEQDSDEDDDETPEAKSLRKKGNAQSQSQGDEYALPKRGYKNRMKERIKHNKSEEEAKSVEIMGRKFSQHTLATVAVLLLFAGFPTVVLLSNIAAIVSGLPFARSQKQASASMPTQNSAATALTPDSLSGKWEIAFQNGQKIAHGMIQMTQSGENIQGWGVDDAGQFQIAGIVQSPKFSFSKNYVNGGKAVGKPVAYAGQLIQEAGQNKMRGTWQLTKRVGYGWRAQILTYTGAFEARQVQAGEASQPGNSSTSSSTGQAQHGQVDPKKAHSFFMQVALGIIGIGVALAMISLKFFGPSGLLNIWAKQEYIPSQFKSQHFKMVKEMGKPISKGGVPLGTRVEWGLHQFWLPKSLAMPLEIRQKNPHMLMIGAGATGKTRLMASMICQDIISEDRAVVVIDSDGILADLTMEWIASRPDGTQLTKRVIVLDPTYSGTQLAYNPLQFPEDGDLQNCASALVFGFKAAYTEPPGSQSQWNQQTANILRNAALLLMANGKTLTDLPVLLSDNDFRDVLLERVEALKSRRSEYITLIDAWTNYKRLARTDQWITWIEPILNRIQPMLGDPRLRTILTKPESELNLQDVIQNRKILIVKIPQGQLDRNGNLLGSLMVAGLKQAALSISSQGKYKEHPCSMYLDEFDNFIEKETFDAITTETRKLQIGFCGVAKTLQTLPEDFRNQIIINVGTIAIFALAKKDADMFGPQMFRVDGRKVKHQTIQNVFNKVNTSPQFELIMDEEKLNIDRVVGQEKRTYFCYRVGTVAGVFRMRAPDFEDIDEKEVNQDLIDRMHQNRQGQDDAEAREEDAEDDVPEDDTEDEDEQLD